MDKFKFHLALPTIVLLFESVLLSGATKPLQSLGLFTSPKGFGLTYSYELQDGDLANLNLWGDIYGLLSGKTTFPGIKANYSRLHPFATVRPQNSRGSFQFYAGPGISGGWVMDNGYGNSTSTPTHGAVLALSGTIGARYNFNGLTSIDLSLAAEAGLHLTGFGSSETFRTRFYRNGIFQAWYPQLKIEHIFQSRASSSSGSDHGFGSRRARFVYGLEWGLSPTIYEIHKYIYLDDEIGCLMPQDKHSGFTFHNNAFVMGNIGLAFGLHSDLRIEGGYMGAYRDVDMYPVALRYTFLFRNQQEYDGRSAYLRIGGGIGYRPKGFLKYWIHTDGGWRFPVSRTFTMEIGGGLKIIYDRPNIKNADTGKYVSRKNIRRNDAWYLSPCFSMAINF